MENCSTWKQHINFPYTQNHVGIIINYRYTLESFPQAEQLQQFPYLIECQMKKKYNSTESETARSTVQDYIKKKLDPGNAKILNQRKPDSQFL